MIRSRNWKKREEGIKALMKFHRNIKLSPFDIKLGFKRDNFGKN